MSKEDKKDIDLEEEEEVDFITKKKDGHLLGVEEKDPDDNIKVGLEDDFVGEDEGEDEEEGYLIDEDGDEDEVDEWDDLLGFKDED